MFELFRLNKLIKVLIVLKQTTMKVIILMYLFKNMISYLFFFFHTQKIRFRKTELEYPNSTPTTGSGWNSIYC